MGEYEVLTASLAVACAAVLGLAVALARTRRRWRAAVGERGWLLEREREGAAEAAITAERDRIARELHDIVSHNVSLMVVQASAAREVLGTMPDEAATALRAVEDAGRGALTELRHLLGLLAPAPDGTDGDPGPGARSVGRRSPRSPAWTGSARWWTGYRSPGCPWRSTSRASRARCRRAST
ncbi:sensor histidine kinase [Streptomyces rubradiris]|uniref:sensor histidine kinase n=1 Tax=Streptomyces rubradiris TaxID=285531 RepID=UPI0036E0C4FD